MAHQQHQQGNRQQQGNDDNAKPPIIDFGNVQFGRDDVNLFDTTAQRMAQDIVEDGHWVKTREGWKRTKSLGKNKSTQLYKFYDELVMWYDRVFAHGVDREAKYKELAPFIKMLCAKVAYAKGRDLVSDGFLKLFSLVIRAIENPNTLKQAKLFIEAFMGFYKAEEK
jgi:CRISPR-associated protein Csm2